MTPPAGLLWTWIRGAGSGPPGVEMFLLQAVMAMNAREENLLCVLEGKQIITVMVFGGGTAAQQHPSDCTTM